MAAKRAICDRYRNNWHKKLPVCLVMEEDVPNHYRLIDGQHRFRAYAENVKVLAIVAK